MIAVVPRLERRTGMICPNIIIITGQDRGPDEESAAAVQMLTERYNNPEPLIHFKFTVHAHNEMTA